MFACRNRPVVRQHFTESSLVQKSGNRIVS
jgi:hypothetical protein